MLIVGQRSPSVSSHGYLSTEDHITWNLNTSGKVRKRRRERPTRYRTSKTEGTITCNLMTEMTVHHIDIFYPLKQVPKSSLHLRRGIIQGLKYQKAGITGHHLRNCLPQDALSYSNTRGFPNGSSGKEPTCNIGDLGDTGSIPGSGRSPEGGNGNPFQ